ncbi:LytTR family DNA-binding domain-containing protein [Apibacter sp. HY039]|uniref:LytR/AlgR family response regulator transcription factor n=1 Tax=Apibacter sp. HY039 TaxID=2501476 RepID=UPI000FEBCA12|nr:LytTR family DNA-binding domain-containing protein [Apibacter sp. HY039]
MAENKITCIIVDDEPMALNLIESYVIKTPFLELKGKFSNAIDALAFLNKEKINLLFLDIQMPELTGMELAETLTDDSRVVFTTAFDQYALDGYKVKALDYLLKPFDYKEFLLAANKAKEWFSLLNHHSLMPQITPVSTASYFFIRSEYKQIKIIFDTILYIEGLKDYVKIWLVNEPKPILTLMSLKKLEEELPKNNFMRIHRSFIIALDKIQSVEKNQVVINQQHITISDQYKDNFQQFLQTNSAN